MVRFRLVMSLALLAFGTLSTSAFADSFDESKLSACESKAVDAAVALAEKEYGATEVTGIDDGSTLDQSGERPTPDTFTISIQNSDERIYLSIDVKYKPTKGSCRILRVEVVDISS
jgi:hypothetical protein